ncbi:hypothetical protein AURDEDRAFT_177623 [Auricularia subglabra TFB-10046 SS5]|uniref:F-box domain-containing protein n=1 Tax=Auricularia subglabra (strain TFB-10046 / SS5) TaxID=717982 RepID=J0D3N9_AURST|nr:hypothetical protein AURDEDRAFT_177623 [Auricularia subglabra TFB-10046 SS5]
MRTVHSLPVELLALVFVYIPAPQLVRFMLVCKHWYFAMKSPSPWNVLVLRADSIVIRSLPALLQRSGSLPLSLSLIVPLWLEHRLPDVCAAVTPHMVRMRHLAIRGERISYCSSIFELLHQPAPMLVSIDLSPTPSSINRLRGDFESSRLDGDGDTEALLISVANQLRTVDLGLLRLPDTHRVALSSATTLSVTIPEQGSSSLAGLFTLAPVLDTLVVKDNSLERLLLCPPPGRRLAEFVVLKAREATVPWTAISSYAAASVRAIQSHSATCETVWHAMRDPAWLLRSLTIDYGLAFTAAFHSGECVRYLQTFGCERTDGSSACTRLMYDARFLHRIQSMTLSLALRPGVHTHSGHLLPHLLLPALTRLTILCGDPVVDGYEPAHTSTLFDEAVLARSSVLRAPNLRCIRLATRDASSSHLAHAHDRYPGRVAAVSPAALARFIARTLCADGRQPIGLRPELEVDAPRVRLLDDPDGLLLLTALVTKIS